MSNNWGLKDHDQKVERIDHPIEYNRDSVFALGCSCTWGIGVERESTWARILQEKIGLPVYNLGVPGGSADGVFRQLVTYLPIVQPRIVCIQAPSDYRREVILEYDQSVIDGPQQIGGWNAKERGLVDLLGDKEIAMNKKRNYNAIIQMCRRYDTEIRFMRFGYGWRERPHPNAKLDDNPWQLERTPPAADGLHPGTAWHAAVAELFLNCPTDLDRIYDYVD